LTPHLKIYYAAPKANKFKIVTPIDPNDKSIYVINPQNAAKPVESQAASRSGVKIVKRTFVSSEGHFANSTHVGSLYFSSGPNVIPNIDMHRMFSLTAYNQLMTALKSRSIHHFSTPHQERSKYGKVAALAAIGSKRGVGLKRSLNNLQKAKKNLKTIRSKSTNAPPAVMLKIMQVFNVYEEIEAYVNKYLAGYIKPDKWDPPSLSKIHPGELSNVYYKTLKYISRYIVSIIQRYTEGSSAMIAFGILLDNLSEEDRKEIRNLMPDIIGFRASGPTIKGKKLIDTHGKLYENLNISESDMAEFIDFQIVSGVAQISAAYFGKDDEIDSILNVEQSDEEDEEIVPSGKLDQIAAISENKLYKSIINDIIATIKS
jgi:hypothetical protein